MRLIDADELKNEIVKAGQANRRGKYHLSETWELTCEEIYEVVDKMPTIEDLSGFCDRLWRGAYEQGKRDAFDRLIDRAALFNRLSNAKTMEEVFVIIQGMPSGLVTV